MKDYPISQLRIVVLRMCHTDLQGNTIPADRTTTHMMHQSQVDTFVKATVKLHHTLGNPHHKDAEGNQVILPLRNLYEIRVQVLNTDTSSHWWCAESLSAKDPEAAKLNRTLEERVWAHPALIEKERREREWLAAHED